jgi:hypothetical protein
MIIDIFRYTTESFYMATFFVIIAQNEHPPIEIMMVFTPFWLFVTATLFGMIAGVAALVRATPSKEPVTTRQIVNYSLNCGTLGASVSLFTYSMYAPMNYLDLKILGVVGFLCLGGLTAIELVAGSAGQWIKNIIKSFRPGQSDQ